MKNIILLFGFLLLAVTSSATHVLGGNFAINYIGPNQYQIVVYLWRSCESGAAPMPSAINIGIYQKGTNNQVLTETIYNPIISTNLPFGDSAFTPTLCIDQGIFVSNTITLPYYVGGYFLHTQYFARKVTIDNLLNPEITNMSLYAEIPNPAIGQNSSPQFDTYPQDAYLCAGYIKYFNFNVTDPDGDSLSYSLVDPLDGATASPTGNGTYPPPYPSVTWNTVGGYSLSSIVGGSPPMSVDPLTGVINASPIIIGEYVFALKVTEWRNGVKIGEVTRDILYKAFPCTINVSLTEKKSSILKVYPNPTNSQILIDINGYQGPVNIEIYDLQGRLLESTNRTTISLKNYSKGIYLFKVYYGYVAEEVRVVKN